MEPKKQSRKIQRGKRTMQIGYKIGIGILSIIAIVTLYLAIIVLMPGFSISEAEVKIYGKRPGYNP